MATGQRQELSNRAVNLGLVANAVLAAVKTVIGVVGHSSALLADGINSMSDVAYYLVVRVFVRLAGKEPDEQHPYGHSQMESIGALVVGSFVITTAVAIFWDAVNSSYDLFTARTQSGSISAAALWVALVTVFVKIILTLVTRGIGKKTNNAAILALAYDHRNDIFSAAGAATGIFLGRAGLPWADPLAGAVVSLVVLVTGIRILRESSANLMDAVPGQPLTRQIREVTQAVNGVHEVEEILAHHFGPYLVVNMTIGIDGALSVGAGDRIASEIEARLLREVPFLRRVHVHYHPAAPRSPVAGD